MGNWNQRGSTQTEAGFQHPKGQIFLSLWLSMKSHQGGKVGPFLLHLKWDKWHCFMRKKKGKENHFFNKSQILSLPSAKIQKLFLTFHVAFSSSFFSTIVAL